jgi:hypothetical protein
MPCRVAASPSAAKLKSSSLSTSPLANVIAMPFLQALQVVDGIVVLTRAAARADRRRTHHRGFR